jgi:hypothetical protein
MENNERNSNNGTTNKDNNKNNITKVQHEDLKKRLIKIILTSLAAHVGWKVILSVIGFGPWGVMAGTLASYMMHFAATHNIPISFLIAFLQSAGAGLLPSMRFITQTGVIAFIVQPEVREKLEKIKQEVAAKLGFDSDKIKIIAKTKKSDDPRSKL